jgi:hypothetical protein
MRSSDHERRIICRAQQENICHIGPCLFGTVISLTNTRSVLLFFFQLQQSRRLINQPRALDVPVGTSSGMCPCTGGAFLTSSLAMERGILMRSRLYLLFLFFYEKNAFVLIVESKRRSFPMSADFCLLDSAQSNMSKVRNSCF